LLVIDFKTDRVRADEITCRADVYRGQLQLYAKAAAAICREKVLDKWLYFLAARQPVRI
jgi:ATP-dependent exoDNAse (exonuclease V) beta subunit